MLGTDLFILVLVIEMLALAIAILRRKPVVIVPRIIAGAVILPFLPVLAVVIGSLVANNLTSDFVFSLVLLILILLFCVIIIGASAVLAAQYIWLFNVTETMLMDALSSILQKQGLKCSQSQSSGLFARLSRMPQITVTVAEQDSLRVTVAPFGRAWVRFVGKQRDMGNKVMVDDLKRILSTNKCGKSTALGFLYTILSIAMIGMFIYSLI